MASPEAAARRIFRSVVAPALRVSLPALLAGSLPGCARGADADAKPAITSEPAQPPTVSALPTAPAPPTASALPPSSASAEQDVGDRREAMRPDAGATPVPAPSPGRVPRTYPRPGPAPPPPPGPAARPPPGPRQKDLFLLVPGLAPQAALASAGEGAGPRPSRGTRRQTDPDRARLLRRRVA
jgi:hypothetical protein